MEMADVSEIFSAFLPDHTSSLPRKPQYSDALLICVNVIY